MEFSFFFLSKFKSRDNDKSYWKANRAFEKITKQKKFAKIAKYKKGDSSFRNKAIEKLDRQVYQHLLSDIAVNDKDFQIRMTAAKFLTNEQTRQSVYLDIAKSNQIGYLSMEAAKLLTNKEIRQSVYADIAKNADWIYRGKAVENLDAKIYQSLLVEIAKTDSESSVRKEAIKKINAEDNQPLLAEIARNSNERWKKEEAYLAKQHALWEMKEAFKKLTDEKIITEIALQSKNNEIVSIAVDLLTNQEHLLVIAENLTRYDKNDFGYFVLCYENLLKKLGKDKMPELLDNEYKKAEKEKENDDRDYYYDLYVKGQNCG